MSLPRIFWDVETSAAKIAELEAIMPEFKPDSRLKDKDKISESIAEKRQAFIDDAALKSTTGRIICYTKAWNNDEPVVHCGGTESGIIDIMVEDFGYIVSQNGDAFSFNGHGFDLPFAAQRACAIGRPVLRKLLFTRFKGRLYPHESQIDILKEWLCGGYEFKGHSLDVVAKTFGLEGKTGHGKDFAKLLETDREKALAYAKQDVELVRQIANKLGL